MFKKIVLIILLLPVFQCESSQVENNGCLLELVNVYESMKSYRGDEYEEAFLKYFTKHDYDVLKNDSYKKTVGWKGAFDFFRSDDLKGIERFGGSCEKNEAALYLSGRSKITNETIYLKLRFKKINDIWKRDFSMEIPSPKNVMWKDK